MLSKVSTLALAAAGSLSALAGAALAQDQPYPTTPDQPYSDTPYAPQQGPERYGPSRLYQDQQPDEPGAQDQSWRANPSNGLQTGYTQSCRFNYGPRDGQTVDFSGKAGAASVPVGSRCADMQGSSGVAVGSGEGQRAGETGRFYQSPGSPNAWENGGLKKGYTLTCQFNRGPRLGSTFNFSGTLGAEPVPLGKPCADGASAGIGVEANTGRWPDHPF